MKNFNPIELPVNKKILCCTSGGLTSMYKMEQMLRMGLHLNNDIVAIFANTGWEHEKTLIFVYNCQKRWKELYDFDLIWLEAKVYHEQRKSCGHKEVTFNTTSRKLEPFEEAIKKYGIPNNGYPWCTRELKENPIKSYLQKVKKMEKGELYDCFRYAS